MLDGMPEATATPQPVLADVDDFLAWVQGQPERYEFAGGRLVMMAGGSEDHNDIQINLLTSLKRRLRGGPCKPNGSDLLVRIDDRTGRFPDASITCGREGRHYITAPVAIFEILSPTTELLDRTEKRRDYQRLPSLRHYVLISQDAPRVEIYSRTTRGWRFEEIEGMDAALPLETLRLTLPMAEIYDGLTFPQASEAEST
jgi:Uma2 family endonuclease